MSEVGGQLKDFESQLAERVAIGLTEMSDFVRGADYIRVLIRRDGKYHQMEAGFLRYLDKPSVDNIS